jgi:ribosome-associated protein
VDEALRVSNSCVIPLDEIEWRFDTSGGAGGQHANRARTRVEVSFDVEASVHLSEHHRRRFLTKLGPVVKAASNDERSQLRNREVALDRLRSKLADALKDERPRHATRPTRGSKERRLSSKRRRSDVKRERRKPARDD